MCRVFIRSLPTSQRLLCCLLCSKAVLRPIHILPVCHLKRTLYWRTVYFIRKRALTLSSDTSPFSLRAFLAAFTSA